MIYTFIKKFKIRIMEKLKRKTVGKMNERLIKFALAVDANNFFQPEHFGNADKFLIYEWKGNELIFLQEVINPFKSLDEEHGAYKKGMAIIELLKNMSVKSLVSKQFGENIKLVNSYFIPVIIHAETPGEVLPVLLKHIEWIEEEVNNERAEFKLFTIKKGIMKSEISGKIT
jgi:predicted Fe-Mo cluster-binding NifX family protein